MLDLMIVGEAWGASEAAARKPFIGASGNLLDQMLAANGLSRHNAHVTNVVNWQPPKNDFKWFTKTDEGRARLMLGLHDLHASIIEHKPNLVLALGDWALHFLTGKSGISKWRGSLLTGTIAPVKVLATYHPAAIFRTWEYKAIVEFDLRKAARHARFPELRLPQRTYILSPSDEELEKLHVEFSAADWIAFDIETYPDDRGFTRIDCIGFSDHADRAVVIDMRRGSFYANAFVHDILKSRIPKVAQYGTFDVTILRENGFIVNAFDWDIMLGHHALISECASGDAEHTKKKAVPNPIAKSLAFQASIYTDEPYWKDEIDSKDRQVFLTYNGKDAAVTREIRDVQEREINEFGVVSVLKHSMSLLEPTMAMTKRGIRIDLVLRERLRHQYNEEITRLQTFLDGSVGKPINTSSTKDIRWLLYDRLGLPEQKHRKTGNVTADKDALTKLAHKTGNVLLNTIKLMREKRTIMERYLNVSVDDDSRMRCSWNIAGTKSGRLSSGVSLNGSGTNLQNIPDSMREMFIPDAEKVFISADYSQAEARVVAYLARDSYLIELFSDPSRDIHRETAARIFNKPVEAVNDFERFVGKRVRHAVNYGMDADRFVEIVNEDAEETGFRIERGLAKRAIEGFFMMHPNHRPVFWGNVMAQIKATRTVSTAFGRKRMFFGRWGDDLLRSAYSHYPQGTIGDLCGKAMVRCYHEIELGEPSYGYELLLNVHDSIVAQCDEAHVPAAIEKMRECMNIPITVDGHTFTIPVDVAVGRNWRKAQKDGSNVDGLKEV